MFVHGPTPERYLYLCLKPDGRKTDAGLSMICTSPWISTSHISPVPSVLLLQNTKVLSQ